MKNKTKTATKSKSSAPTKHTSRKPPIRVHRVQRKLINTEMDSAAQLDNDPKLTDSINKILNELQDVATDDVIKIAADDVIKDTENNDKATGLAAWLITRSALQRVQQFENLVADATKEYWQAKRKLLLINKILNSTYKSLEIEDMENIKIPSKEEINSVIADALANELFPSNSDSDKNIKSHFPTSDNAKTQMFKRLS
jgi:hypothetical protein